MRYQAENRPRTACAGISGPHTGGRVSEQHQREAISIVHEAKESQLCGFHNDLLGLNNFVFQRRNSARVPLPWITDESIRCACRRSIVAAVSTFLTTKVCKSASASPECFTAIKGTRCVSSMKFFAIPAILQDAPWPNRLHRSSDHE